MTDLISLLNMCKCTFLMLECDHQIQIIYSTMHLNDDRIWNNTIFINEICYIYVAISNQLKVLKYFDIIVLFSLGGIGGAPW